MEIDESLYEQYRDTPYKINICEKNQQNSNQDDVNYQNCIKSDYNEYLGKINESINEPKGRRLTDNITLRASIDKSNQNLAQGSYLSSNNNSMNLETQNKSQKNYEPININDQNKFNDKKMKRDNICYINNLYNKEILLEKNGDNYNNDNLNNTNIEGKVMIVNNNYGGSNFSQNYNNNSSEKENNKFKMPNIILKVIDDDEESNKKKEGGGLFSGLFDFCKKKKENKNNEEANNLNNGGDELETIEQKLTSEPYELNDNKLEKDIKKEGNNENIILTSTQNKKFKYNFILSNTLTEENTKNDIIKLKNGLNNNYNQERQNDEALPGQNIQNSENEPFIENQNVYYNQNGQDKKSFYVAAEPIENNPLEQENNLGTSSEIIDIDKSSEYTLETGTNIDHLVKKKSKLPWFLIALGIGSAGLLFLIYKNIKIREFLRNLIEKMKNLDFFGGLVGLFKSGINDFLERYNDSYRFFGFLALLIFFWVILKLLMKFVLKRMRKKNKNSNNN